MSDDFCAVCGLHNCGGTSAFHQRMVRQEEINRLSKEEDERWEEEEWHAREQEEEAEEEWLHRDSHPETTNLANISNLLKLLIIKTKESNVLQSKTHEILQRIEYIPQRSGDNPDYTFGERLGIAIAMPIATELAPLFNQIEDVIRRQWHGDSLLVDEDELRKMTHGKLTDAEIRHLIHFTPEPLAQETLKNAMKEALAESKITEKIQEIADVGGFTEIADAARAEVENKEAAIAASNKAAKALRKTKARINREEIAASLSKQEGS